ncbi:hypothetical protein [Mesorhizobium sp. dw_380]|uniref:hypothetical protein n=1 Tax=Mesorhizobium sp. dw_380 TaxID=2812001 RepID=UPI001BDED8E2|nr:hypothetical protein [Mesorhizobium sp. dw_380]
MTLDQADQTLRDAMKQALTEYALDMHSRGIGHEEISTKLDAYFEVMKTWRWDTLTTITRIINEPKAPTHSLQ